MKYKSTTRKWIVNNLLIIVALLIFAEILIIFSVRNYYYQYARNSLTSSASVINSLLVQYSTDSTKNMSTEIKNIVQNYSQKDSVELMAIDHNGFVQITSSGFPVKEGIQMPDYEEALIQNSGSSTYEGKSSLGEKIMATTILLPTTNKDYSALRFVVSMKNTDRIILQITLAITLICILMIALISTSGLYFVKSIVIPVREIGNVAEKIASGDLKARIVRNSDDEIGRLCETVNHMADELENTEKVKYEFISSISHELRTPLTAIKGWSETILASGNDDYQIVQKGMQVIDGETERLTVMVEELLDFSRIQTGYFKLNRTKLDILAELGEAVLEYGEQARSEGKTIRYDEPEMLPPIYGDKNRLRQVFINIIDNALKYSEDGAIINIKAEATDEWVVISIMDTGCGINEKDLPHITEKFYKANHTKRGSGIGLAVAREIIENHGGNVIIESEEEVGTLVTIKLPIYSQTEKNQTGDLSLAQELILTEDNAINRIERSEDNE